MKIFTKHRYCPNCKRVVGVKYTAGQVVVMICLYLCFIVPGIVYTFLHPKKCPICASLTEEIVDKKQASNK